MERVYNMILQKAVHSRFAVVVRRWKQCHVKKNSQLALHTKLKAANSSSKSNKSRKSADEKSELKAKKDGSQSKKRKG